MIGVDEWNRTHGHDSKGLGGAVDDGDQRHPKHSHMVRQCGLWLNQQQGVLVYATGTGRWTGGPTYGTPGISDLVGWRARSIPADFGPNPPHIDIAQFLAVECKVGKDKLNKAQRAFRKEAEAAGVLYFLVEWDGESGDPAADLKAQWQTQENPDG